ncbi:E3 ubiquitin-protein ligase TRIM39-like [Acipenser ruthenus]|uniref:E3 ubiquitin-protein ligase TRIM39-like n=1 Tax=Acipenser ruthenus TaxID=7906 RepID=UPI0027422850|nr:E3 ubiquitin-protein ligase TRIM39-like [Acipenser ruthenus]
MSDSSSDSLVLCTLHNEGLILYCRDCRLCICPACLVNERHRSHSLISFKDACKAEKGILEIKAKQLKKNQEKLQKNLQQLSASEKEVEETVEKVKNSVKAMYGEMRALLEQDEQNTYRLIEAEYHNMLRQIHSRVNGGFNLIEAAMNVVENVEHMDNFKLAECGSINILMEVNSMKTSIEAFEAIHISLGKDVQVDNKRLKSLENCVDEILKSTKKFLPRPWQYSENITFDENTAHRNLRVTEDRREIRFVSQAQSVLEKPERFTKTPNVMATQIFSSGRHYWEVMLKGKENWGVGVAYPTMSRTGTRRDMTLGFNKESWVFQLSDGEFYAMHNGDAIHLICKKFHRLGVFLDYEDGKLSFYAVDNFCLLYTFKTKFRKPVTPAFKTYDKSSTWPLVLCPMLPEPKEPVSDIGEPNPTKEDSVSYFSERL